MSRRKLGQDELELWQQVAGTAERMHPERVFALPKQAQPKRKPAPQNPPLNSFQIGTKHSGVAHSHDLIAPLPDRLAQAPVKMDAKSFGKLKRGKIVPEGRIDLHGMTVSEAHPALISFILRAHRLEKRLVLVITGKGRSKRNMDYAPQRMGILKAQVPQWLVMPPLRGSVLQVAEAHISHGGSGAYYVYLRRNR